MISFGYQINAGNRPDRDKVYEREPDSDDGVREHGDLTRIWVRR